MKTLKSILLFGTFLLFSLAFGFCVKSLSDAIVATDFQESEFINHVDVTLAKSSQGDIIIIAQGQNTEPNTLYFFQSTKLPQNLNTRIADATIIKNKDYILVHSDNKNILLSLEKAIIPKNVQTLEDLTTYIGYGVTKFQELKAYQAAVNQLRKETLDINSRSAGYGGGGINIDYATCKCYSNDIPSKGVCNAGGEGSNSCSYDDTRPLPLSGTTTGSKCSTTCDKGYYACCTGAP